MSVSRKLTKEDIYQLLANRFKEDRCTKLAQIPKPSELKDITKAAKRIKKAIQMGEKIAVVGDYDADGVISSAIIMEFFEDLGVDATLKIPNRFEDGYGISPEIVKRLDAQVIVTVDNGISALEAGEVCVQRGIDLIITDHHTAPEKLPQAYAIVNPKQHDCDFPNSEICGAQVAWYLCAAIKEEMQIEYNLSKFLDILAIAIMADMMELKDINRTMVKSGLKFLNQKRRPVFRAIADFFNKNTFRSEDISFLIGPLINSSGRIEDATRSYELLRAKTNSEAMEKLLYIVDLNNHRKEIELELFNQALEKIDQNKKIIVVWGEGWHEGVIGIVASRLSRRFHKPAVVFSVNAGIAKGSARSVGEINILEHISKQADLLKGYGGHKGAAGMGLESENLPLFKARMEASLEEVHENDFVTKTEVLGEIEPSAIDFELLDILEEFEPYGQKNPMPNFILKGAYVKLEKVIGQNQNHQKILLLANNIALESIHFNFTDKVNSGEKVDVVCTVSKNEFRGKISPQLMIKEIKT
jgi:single-stranded-DNA-specific exonuclease